MTETISVNGNRLVLLVVFSPAYTVNDRHS